MTGEEPIDLPRYTGADDERFDIAVSKNKKSKNHRHWERLRWRWATLVEKSEQPVSEPAEEGASVKHAAGGALAGRLAKGPAATPCPEMPCDKTHKTSRTVGYRTLIAMDADTPDDEFMDRVKALGLRTLAYPTASSTADDPRYRVWIAPNRAMLPGQYETVTWELQWLIDRGRGDGESSFDRSSHQYERTMYLPATEDPEYFEANRHAWDGELADVDALLVDAHISDSPQVGKRTGVGDDADEAPYYDDSPERPAEAGVHPLAKVEVQRIIARLVALGLEDWEEGARWDSKVFGAAKDLIRYGNSNWTGYDLDGLRDMFLMVAPDDGEWTVADNLAKWRSARANLKGAGIAPVFEPMGAVAGGGDCTGTKTRGGPCGQDALYGMDLCRSHASEEQKVESAAKKRYDDNLRREATIAQLNPPVSADEAGTRACNANLLLLPEGYMRPRIHMAMVAEGRDIKDAMRHALVQAADSTWAGLNKIGDALALARTREEIRDTLDGSPVDDEGNPIEDKDAAKRQPRVCMPVLEPVEGDLMRAVLRDVAFFYKTTDNGNVVPVSPPSDLAAEILAEGDLPMPSVKAVTCNPFVTAGYDIAFEPGYYAGTLLFEDPTVEWLSVPHTPTAGEVRQARDHIDMVLDGFPFVGGADKANAVGALMTPAVRHLVGLVPRTVVTAPAPGTGKTNLAKIIQITYMGVTRLLTLPEREEERAKTLQTMLMGQPEVIVWDNVRGAIDSPSMDAADTTETLEFRVLGGHVNAVVPVRSFQVMTVNKAQLHIDTVSRVLPIALDAKMENPGERKGPREGEEFKFRIPSDVYTMRARTMWSIHVLIRHWVAQGKPRWKGTFREGFGDWAAVVGGIVQHGGDYEGFLQNLHRFREEHTTEDSSHEGARLAAELLLPYGEAAVADLGESASEWKRAQARQARAADLIQWHRLSATPAVFVDDPEEKARVQDFWSHVGELVGWSGTIEDDRAAVRALGMVLAGADGQTVEIVPEHVENCGVEGPCTCEQVRVTVHVHAPRSKKHVKTYSAERVAEAGK